MSFMELAFLMQEHFTHFVLSLKPGLLFHFLKKCISEVKTQSILVRTDKKGKDF